MKPTVRLSDISIGEYAVITKINLDGAILKRVYDLGFLPGIKIKCVQKAMSGSPIAYSFKSAIIALRKNDADKILCIKCKEERL